MESDLAQNHLIIVAPADVQQRLINKINPMEHTMEWCDNIYKAVAVIFTHLNNRSANAAPLLVIAWVDNLSLAQLKFFSIIAKNGNVVPVAISDFSQKKLNNAVEMGATRALFTDSLAISLFRDNKNKQVEDGQDLMETTSNCDNENIDESEIQLEPGSNNNDNRKSSLLDSDISLSREELDSLLLDENE